MEGDETCLAVERQMQSGNVGETDEDLVVRMEDLEGACQEEVEKRSSSMATPNMYI